MLLVLAYIHVLPQISSRPPTKNCVCW